MHAAACGADDVYVGQWQTTNRKLDGTMTCVETPLVSDNWRGRFDWGLARRHSDYTVNFSGPPHNLRAQATIDGANY
jgi:hypothetical protein